MTAQVMPLNMADMSDEKLADFFFAKAFTDDEPEGEPPTIPKERWRLTPTEPRVHSGCGLAGGASAKR